MTEAKIAVVQLYTSNFDDWAYIVKENKQEYCDRYGYSLITKKGLYGEGLGRHPSWHSILLIKEVLKTTDVDWVFWSDIDALIMDHTIRLEDLIKPNCHMIIPNQGGGLVEYKFVKSSLCCGNYFVKNTQWSKDILQEIWDWPEKYNKMEFLKLKFWEQCAMNYMWHNNIMNFEDRVYVEPDNNQFNAFYSPRKNRAGEFILHFAGFSGKHTIKQLMEKYSRLVRR